MSAGIVAVSAAVPQLLAGFLSGYVVDRWDLAQHLQAGALAHQAAAAIRSIICVSSSGLVPKLSRAHPAPPGP